MEKIIAMVKEILATISDEFSMKISDCYCDKNDQVAVIMEWTWGIISFDELPQIYTLKSGYLMCCFCLLDIWKWNPFWCSLLYNLVAGQGEDIWL